MNVFMIPSWYPTDANQLSGIFIKDQIYALAEHYPEHKFIISHCDNNYLSVTKPFKFVQSLFRYLKKKAEVKMIKQNLTEYYRPALTYSEKLGGDLNNIIEVHLENFTNVQKKYGKTDLIHAHVSYPAGYTAKILKEKFNIPFIITEHMGPFPFDIFLINGKLSDKIAESVSNADNVIAVSNFTARQIQSFGFQNTAVIPNMVNENIFKLPDSQIEKQGLTFLTVASLTESKGITELLEGIKMSKLPDNKFIIAGSGPLENYVEEFLLQNKLLERVNFVKNPARETVIRLFGECDVFILPSRLESFGMVFIEAMACGKPVIATDCGGPSDYIKDFNGLLIPVNSPEDISSAIDIIANNIQRYSAGAIRDYVVRNFSEKAVTSKIISVYKEVIGKTNA